MWRHVELGEAQGGPYVELTLAEWSGWPRQARGQTNKKGSGIPCDRGLSVRLPRSVLPRTTLLQWQGRTLNLSAPIRQHIIRLLASRQRHPLVSL